jgi:hypothetical protein
MSGDAVLDADRMNRLPEILDGIAFNLIENGSG